VSSTDFVRFALMLNALAVAGVLPLAWWLGGNSSLIAALVGGVLGMANFGAAAWSVKRLISASAEGRQALYGLLIVAKLTVLLVVVFVCIRYLLLEPAGFSLGYSAMVLALLIAGFVYSTRSAVEETEREN